MKNKYVLAGIFLAVVLAGCSVSDTTQTADIEMATEKESPSEAEEAIEEVTVEDTEAEDTSEETEKSEEFAEIKITVSYETIEEDRKDESGNVLVSLSYQRPTVTVEGKEDVNALIKQEFDNDEEAFIIQGDEMERDAYSSSIGIEPHSYNSVCYTDKRLDKTIISFTRADDTYYAGTIHGMTYVSGLNFDTQTGAILHLEDIAANKEEFLATARDYILMLCETDEYKDILNPDYEEHVDSLLQEDLWYFDEQGITFIANPYEMAYYAAGILYFTIPYDELQGVKEEYLK